MIARFPSVEHVAMASLDTFSSSIAVRMLRNNSRTSHLSEALRSLSYRHSFAGIRTDGSDFVLIAVLVQGALQVLLNSL